MVGNMTHVELPQMIKKVCNSDDIVFDMISCQFAIHYAFSNENMLTNLLQNIVKLSKIGSHLCMIIMRDDLIIERLLKNYNKNNTYIRYKNDYQMIKMKRINLEHILNILKTENNKYFDFKINNNINHNNSAQKHEQKNENESNNNSNSNDNNDINIFNVLSYEYYQKNAIGSINNNEIIGVEEYLIPFKYFCDILSNKYGFKLILNDNNIDFINKFKEIKPYINSWNVRFPSKPTLNDEKHVINSYRIAIFERIK